MKKIYSLLACLICCIVSIQAQKPFYVHQNDGSINVFYTDMVDSITTTVEAQGGGKYLSYQKIWTADSVYTFDVSRIDSISYVTPATKYKPDVTKLEEGMLDYIIGCDSLTLKLKSDTPNKFIPAVEDKLVCLEMTDILPNGFAGEVVNVEKKSDAVYVECKLISLSQVFDCYYGIHSSEDKPVTNNNGMSPKKGIDAYGEGDWNPQPLNFSLNRYLNMDSKGKKYATEYALNSGISIQPSLRIRSAVIVSKETGTYVSLCCTGSHKVTTDVSFSGAIVKDVKPLSELLRFQIPLGQPFIKAYAEAGPFLNASVEASYKETCELNYGTAILWNWSSKHDEPLKNTCQPIFLKGSSHTIEGSISGLLQTGAYMEVGVNIMDVDIAKAYVDFELGAEFRGNSVITKEDLDNPNSDYTAYDKLVNTEITGQFYGGLGVGAETGIPGAAHIGGHAMVSGPLGEPFFNMCLAPTFSNLDATFNKNNSNGLDVSSNVSGDCIPVNIGYIVQDKDKNKISQQYVWNNYKGNRPDPCKYTFNDVPTNKLLSVSPVISVMGYDVMARPTKEVQADPEAVTGSAVNVKEKSADVYVSFYNIPEEGITAGVEYYSYSSGNQSKTFSINKDGERQVSLTGLEEETTYEYTAFVEWKGERIYGESRQFTTKKKDDGPTEGKWIDLGLSVKWASCNVGASSPEDYGSYFAWGETSPKDSYYWDNCITMEKHMCDISGNSAYDAATANWGAPARMPTKAECKELVNGCTWQWTTYNGVNGMLVTGPNGNSIFLPAAGYRYGTALNNAGEYGLYWSSTPVEDGDDFACRLYFDAYGDGWFDWYYRYYGHSVRPVSN